MTLNNSYIYGNNSPQLFADASGRHPVLVFLAAAAILMNAYTTYEQGGDAVTIVKAAVITALIAAASAGVGSVVGSAASSAGVAVAAGAAVGAAVGAGLSAIAGQNIIMGAITGAIAGATAAYGAYSAKVAGAAKTTGAAKVSKDGALRTNESSSLTLENRLAALPMKETVFGELGGSCRGNAAWWIMHILQIMDYSPAEDPGRFDGPTYDDYEMIDQGAAGYCV